MDKKYLTECVIALKEGDETQFEKIFEIVKDNLYIYAVFCMKDQVKAEDLLQDTFVEIIKSIKNLQNPEAFLTWSKKIMFNLSKHSFKKEESEFPAEVDMDDELEDEDRDYSPEENLDVSELKKIIRDVVESLPPQQSLTMIAFYFDELTISEIADMMVASENTVKTRLYYGRIAVKNEIEEYEKKHNIKLHSLAPIPFILMSFEDIASKNSISAKASKTIIAKALIAHKGLSAGVATATSIGIKKVVAIILAVCVAGGGGYGGVKVYHNYSVAKEEEHKQEIRSAYCDFFNQEMNNINDLAFDESLTTMKGLVIDKNEDRIPEAVMYGSIYSSNKLYICTYLGGKVVKLEENGYDFQGGMEIIPSLYVSKDSTEMSVVYHFMNSVGETWSDEYFAYKYTLLDDKINKEEVVSASSKEPDKLKLFKKKYMDTTKFDCYSSDDSNTEKKEPILFERPEQFFEYLTMYDITPVLEGKETDWKKAYSDYFSKYFKDADYEYETIRNRGMPNEIVRFCARDINFDGIPEIIIPYGFSADIFTFSRGHVQSFIETYSRGGNYSSIHILNNGDLHFSDDSDTVGPMRINYRFSIGKNGFVLKEWLKGPYDLTDSDLLSGGYEQITPDLFKINWESSNRNTVTKKVNALFKDGKELEYTTIESKSDEKRFFKELGVDINY